MNMGYLPIHLGLPKFPHTPCSSFVKLVTKYFIPLDVIITGILFLKFETEYC
jgi:hypothetical protein